MSRCRDLQAALAVWTPGEAALPDALALHIEQCVDCAVRFERAFPPAPLARPRLAAEPRRRLLTAVQLPVRPPWSLVAAGALAAATLLTLSVGPDAGRHARAPLAVASLSMPAETLLILAEDHLPELAWCEVGADASGDPLECPI